MEGSESTSSSGLPTSVSASSAASSSSSVGGNCSETQPPQTVVVRVVSEGWNKKIKLSKVCFVFLELSFLVPRSPLFPHPFSLSAARPLLELRKVSVHCTAGLALFFAMTPCL